ADPCHHPDQFSEHGDGGADVAALPVSEMRRSITPKGWRIGFRHVLPHDVARSEPAHQHRALVANHRPQPVVRPERAGRRARAAFLSQSEVHAADDQALLVKIFEHGLHAAVEQHPAIDGDRLFAREVFRFANRRGRSAQIAFDLVLNIGAFTRLKDAELRTLEAVVRNGVSAKRSGMIYCLRHRCGLLWDWFLRGRPPRQRFGLRRWSRALRLPRARAIPTLLLRYTCTTNDKRPLRTRQA